MKLMIEFKQYVTWHYVVFNILLYVLHIKENIKQVQKKKIWMTWNI